MPSRDNQANSGHSVSHKTITYSVNENDEQIITPQPTVLPPSSSQANRPPLSQADTPQFSVTEEQFADIKKRWDNWESYYRAGVGKLDNDWFEDRITDEDHSREMAAILAEYDALKNGLYKAIAERKAARSRKSVVVPPPQQGQHVAASQAQDKHAGSDHSTYKMPGGWYED